MSPSVKLAAVAALLALGSGCSHAIHLNHTSDITLLKPIEQYDVVSATAEQFTILGWVAQTDYVNEAFDKLQAQCPDGQITGIQTRYSTSHGFFSWTNKIVMRGYCSTTARRPR